MRRNLLVVVIVCAAVSAFAGDLLHVRTKAIRLCTIPKYGYGQRSTSNPVFAFSEVGVPFEAVSALIPSTPAAGAPAAPVVAPVAPVTPVPIPGTVPAVAINPAVRLRAKAYQFIAPALKIDHCAVSNIALTLREDGSWFANFQVEQNPALVPLEVRPIAERFVRNRFYLKFQPMALAPAPPAQPQLGEPQPFVIEVCPFWVEKGQIRTVQLGSQLPAVREYFDTIQRVQVEFRYE